jgi:hypothetical protein
MNPKEGGHEEFLMVHRRDLDSVIDLVKDRRLELRDMAVFNALMAEMEVASGKVKVSATYLADRLGVKLPVCISSLSRLRKELLVSKVRDKRSGSTYFLLNPYVASVGGPQRRGHLWQQFQDSLE